MKIIKSSIPGVFAIGDVTDRVNLTPVAIAEGRAVAENLFNKNSLRVDYNEIATAVFTSTYWNHWANRRSCSKKDRERL